MKRSVRIWLIPLLILTSVSLILSMVTFIVDRGDHSLTQVVGLLLRPDPDSALATLSQAVEVAAGLLAIAVTVVAIVVELAANRYTHRITELFVGEPANFAVMGLFVITALQCFVVSLTYSRGVFVPEFGIALSVVLAAVSLLALLPYFSFVFHFVNPIQIVERMRAHTLEEIARNRPVERRKREAIRGIEQLADVALNAMEHKDKGVSMAGVEALRTMLLDYQPLRAALPPDWYKIDDFLAHNPDFVSMAPEVVVEVETKRNWFELKILRQYQMIYGEALNRMRDINYVIAINTRLLAEAGAAANNNDLVELTIKFFNTFLRSTLNAKDVRTAYNVLNQYRLLAEGFLRAGDARRAIEVAGYFRYYGRVAHDVKLGFVLETVAYDLCQMVEVAFDLNSPAHDALVRVFLELDREAEGEAQETSLRGVRKAQVKLAAHYLAKGREDLARTVHRDMAAERPERLASIRDELLAVKCSSFWEISDRGVNFDYLEPSERAQLLVFFGWFGTSLPAPAALSLPSPAPARVTNP